MTHDVSLVRRVSPHRVVVVCACGHEVEGPNEDTARKRHGLHERIEDARAALRGGRA